MATDLSFLPRQGGYQRIATPADVHGRPDLGIAIDTPADLLAWHVQSLQKYHKPAQWHCTIAVAAFISAGRWVVHCPHCNGGVSCGPAWSVACCFECGAVLDAITYPANAAELEAALLQRHGLFTRNWLVGESLEQLVQENIDHEVTR